MLIKKKSLKRRFLMIGFMNTLLGFIIKPKGINAASKSMTDYTSLTKSDWKKLLSDEAYNVLRQEGTERPFSSSLNDEKRKGTFY